MPPPANPPLPKPLDPEDEGVETIVPAVVVEKSPTIEANSSVLNGRLDAYHVPTPLVSASRSSKALAQRSVRPKTTA